MPNNKEYQDAYNKMYYLAHKEFLNMRRGCYKRTPKPKKVKVQKPLKLDPEPERKEVVSVKTGDYLITWN